MINSAAALVIAGKANDIGQGARLAEAALDDGRARATLEKLIKISNSAAVADPQAAV